MRRCSIDAASHLPALCCYLLACCLQLCIHRSYVPYSQVSKTPVRGGGGGLGVRICNHYLEETQSLRFKNNIYNKLTLNGTIVFVR